MSTTKYFDLHNLEDTNILGRKLAALARPCDVLALSGPLGSGKSALARAFIQSLTSPEQEVPSPTFTLVQIYEAAALTTFPLMIWHFDCYRLNRPEEVFELGFDEATNSGICLIEWPERLETYIPTHRLEIKFEIIDNSDMRRAILTSHHQWDDRIKDLL